MTWVYHVPRRVSNSDTPPLRSPVRLSEALSPGTSGQGMSAELSTTTNQRCDR